VLGAPRRWWRSASNRPWRRRGRGGTLVTRGGSRNPPLLAASLSDGQCVWHVYEDLGQPSLEHHADAEALESLRGADAALTEEQAALRGCLLADVATR
jgi:hypothetical protein